MAETVFDRDALQMMWLVKVRNCWLPTTPYGTCYLRLFPSIPTFLSKPSLFQLPLSALFIETADGACVRKQAHADMHTNRASLPILSSVALPLDIV